MPRRGLDRYDEMRHRSRWLAPQEPLDPSLAPDRVFDTVATSLDCLTESRVVRSARALPSLHRLRSYSAKECAIVFAGLYGGDPDAIEEYLDLDRDNAVTAQAVLIWLVHHWDSHRTAGFPVVSPPPSKGVVNMAYVSETVLRSVGALTEDADQLLESWRRFDAECFL
jgi:hypothetical protein